MEADWAAEIGPHLPSIDIPWDGFIDLRKNLYAINTIAEAALHPALSSALCAFNAEDSLLFTSKCDQWTMEEAIDPDEFAAPVDEAQITVASYIDILPRDPTRLASLSFHENWARQLTSALHNLPVAHGRIDLVLRPATVDQHPGFGITLYTAGCGADASTAKAAWQAVLAAAIPATISSAAKAILNAGE